MNRPLYLREETWLFLLQALANLRGSAADTLKSLGYVLPPQDHSSNEDLLYVLEEQPAPFLVHAGILKYPSLTKGTIIEYGQDHFLITENTAQALRRGEDVLVLFPADEGERRVVLREDLVAELSEGLLFDQLASTE